MWSEQGSPHAYHAREMGCWDSTCIHIIGPPAGLAAAGGRGAACPRVEDIIDRALQLAVIDGFGALGGAGGGTETGRSGGAHVSWSPHLTPSLAHSGQPLSVPQFLLPRARPVSQDL